MHGQPHIRFTFVSVSIRPRTVLSTYCRTHYSVLILLSDATQPAVLQLHTKSNGSHCTAMKQANLTYQLLALSIDKISSTEIPWDFRLPLQCTYVYTVFALLDQGSSDLPPLKMGPTGSPETSVHNYQHTLRNNPDNLCLFTIAWVFAERNCQTSVYFVCNNSHNNNTNPRRHFKRQSRLRNSTWQTYSPNWLLFCFFTTTNKNHTN